MSEVQQIITEEVIQRTLMFAKVPMQNPDILPNLLPLILGAVVMELYFGKHKEEQLGWNTSVGNAVIWVSTGFSLLMSRNLAQPELQATYALIGIGAFVAFMDFYHIWPSSIAFIVSSSATVYTMAWILVLVIKTDVPLNETTLKAAGLFFIAINILFKFVQGFESDMDDSFGNI